MSSSYLFQIKGRKSNTREKIFGNLYLTHAYDNFLTIPGRGLQLDAAKEIMKNLIKIESQTGSNNELVQMTKKIVLYSQLPFFLRNLQFILDLLHFNPEFLRNFKQMREYVDKIWLVVAGVVGEKELRYKNKAPETIKYLRMMRDEFENLVAKVKHRCMIQDYFLEFDAMILRGKNFKNTEKDRKAIREESEKWLEGWELKDVGSDLNDTYEEILAFNKSICENLCAGVEIKINTKIKEHQPFRFVRYSLASLLQFCLVMTSDRKNVMALESIFDKLPADNPNATELFGKFEQVAIADRVTT